MLVKMDGSLNWVTFFLFQVLFLFIFFDHFLFFYLLDKSYPQGNLPVKVYT